jgi:phage tail-like protein
MAANASSNETAYVANRFALELDDKKNAGFISALDGAHFKAQPIKQMVGNTNNVTIYSGKPSYDDITITVGMAMSPSFWKWVKASLDNKPERRTGALVGYDFNNCERSRRTFYGALISQVQFPALDPQNKTSASLQVTISPERLEFKKGDNSKAGQNTAPGETPKQKRWLTANFRFELDRFKGDESLRTLSLEAFTVKQNVIPQNIGYELESRKAVGRLELPQLQVSFPEHKGSEWIKWYERAIVKGNRKDQTTTGVLTYYSTDKKELMRIEFSGVSLASLEVDKYDSKKSQIANITATLNVEGMNLVPGEGNV